LLLLSRQFQKRLRKMADNQLQLKLQGAVDVMMNTLDIKRLRPMQKKAYLEMAACYDTKTFGKDSTGEQIQSCVQNSQRPIQMSQQIVQQEFNNFQQRIQRCGASCEDSVRDGNQNLEDQSQVDKAQGQMTACMSTCVGKRETLSIVIGLCCSVLEKIKKNRNLTVGWIGGIIIAFENAMFD
jgi:hypothetical protein